MSIIKDTDKIDLITYNKPLKQLVLVMVEPREWCSDKNMYKELNKKINNYLSYVEDGQMMEDYGNLDIDSVKLELLHSYEFNEHARKIIEALQEYLLSNNYSFDHRLLDDSNT